MNLDQALVALGQNRGAPDWPALMRPDAVTLNRFLADDFVFILGISLSFRCTIKDRPGMPFTGQAA
jgi:hypothetical protein